jgi:CheY-like chemotaxis protein
MTMSSCNGVEKAREGMMHHKGASRLRIAVAEDDADLRGAFVGMLELLGNEVVCAACDGAELLDACSRLEVDLVLVDLDMPVIDGLQAAEALAEKGIPVVLISGHPDVKEVVLEHEPVVTRIVKPATIEGFRKAIAEALATRR